MKKYLALILAVLMCLSVMTACGKTEEPAPAAPAAPAAAEPAAEPAAETEPAVEPLVIQVGFENTTEEPVGRAVVKWAELIEEQSNGTIKFELFPNSALGSKSELVDQMVMGENVITITDASFNADYGATDMGIMYGPFFFASWDDVWKLLDSDWYAEQCQILADKGVTILASNWIYGERELMTKEKVVLPEDMKGMKIRLANSPIYVEGFNALGATAVPMALGDVYTSLQNGTLDGVENPLSTLWGQSFQEVCSHIVMTGHIKNFSTWVIGTDYFQSLTAEQQALLKSTAEEAGIYNNQLKDETDVEYAQMLTDAGVEIIELTPEEIAVWKKAGESFYDLSDSFGWSEGLYETTQAAMK